MQKVVYMSNEKNCSPFHLLLRCLIQFCVFFVLLHNSFAIVGFVTTTFDKLQLKSRTRLSQINVIDPIRLKFELYAVFIK